MFVGLYPGNELVKILRLIIDDQLKTIVQLSRDEKRSETKNGSGKFAELKKTVGNGNFIARILLELDSRSMSRISGLPESEFGGNRLNNGLWYLQRLHGEIGRTGIPVTLQKRRNGGFVRFAGSYYKDRRVQESFSLLAFFRSDKDSESRVKFRKIKDIKTLKDLLKIKITQSSRKVTRQDMSLLTLSLNGQNSSTQIRQSWEDTLAVINSHLDLSIAGKNKEYLFAPHYPYFVYNNSGFLYTPDRIEDIRNAVGWGGRNDILLSSYLHFRNLPGELPAWLLKAAVRRSEAEQAIIRRLEQRSFYPMILECERDSEQLPESLFSAKWKIRKPFGEDIFPGTLLLLRLGYLEVNREGEFVFTEKMVRRR